MTDLIQRLVAAIERQEGQEPTSTNPGDIRDPVWFPGSAPAVSNGEVISNRCYYDGTLLAYRLQAGTGEAFWVPRTREEGESGIAHICALHIAQGDSLQQLIRGSPHYAGYAPSADGNQTAAYITNVAEWASIPNAEEPLWNYL